jgi:hypothetical protein
MSNGSLGSCAAMSAAIIAHSRSGRIGGAALAEASPAFSLEKS